MKHVNSAERPAVASLAIACAVACWSCDTRTSSSNTTGGPARHVEECDDCSSQEGCVLMLVSGSGRRPYGEGRLLVGLYTENGPSSVVAKDDVDLSTLDEESFAFCTQESRLIPIAFLDDSGDGELVAPSGSLRGSDNPLDSCESSYNWFPAYPGTTTTARFELFVPCAYD